MATLSLKAQLGPFWQGEPLKIGAFALHYTARRTRRLVVVCCDEDQSLDWIDPICEETGFSQITVTRLKETAPDPNAPQLGAALKAIVAATEFKACDAYSLCAAETACDLLVEIAEDLPKQTVVTVIDPPPELLGEAVERLEKVAKGSARSYMFYDPFNPETASLALPQHKRLTLLKGIGFYPSILNGLGRMRLSYEVLAGTLQGEMESDLFYSLIRARKTYRFYRIGVETALKHRGKADKALEFHRLFRNRRLETHPNQLFDDFKRKVADAVPMMTGAWARGGGTLPASNWPSEPGNIWMLEQTDEGFRYLSDRWGDRTIGFEEREGVTLAQTPPTAYAFMVVGGEAHAPRARLEPAPWHVVDASLNGNRTLCAAMAEATMTNRLREIEGQGMFTLLGLTQAQSGITAADMAPDGKTYAAALDKLRQAKNNMERWGKPLAVDRIRLGLLRGDVIATAEEAIQSYSNVARRLTADVMSITGQDAPPLLVVVQGPGFVSEGAIEALLAEGRFEEDNPDLKAVVATPSYPFALMADTASTPSPDSALLIDELCALAAQASHAGQRWFCPALQYAEQTAPQEIIAEFSALEALVLGKAPHGFRLWGQGEMPDIVEATVLDRRKIRLVLEADLHPQEALFLSYAWGNPPESRRHGLPANCGALRDEWSQPSQAVSGRRLYRYALSGRVPVINARR